MGHIDTPTYNSDGPAPYDDPLPDDTRAPLILSISGLFYGLAVLTVLLRMYTQLTVVRRVALHDYLVLLSCACSTILLASFIADTAKGLGRHAQFLSADEKSYLVRSKYFKTIFGTSGIFFAQISFCIYLVQLVPYQSKARNAVRLIIACLSLWAIVVVLLEVFPCTPISDLWDKTDGNCLSSGQYQQMLWAYFCIDTMINLTLSALPMFILYGTTKSRLSTVVCVGIAGIGFVVLAASIVRVFQASVGLKPQSLPRSDELPLWSFIENTSAIIAASLFPLVSLSKRLTETLPVLSRSHRQRPYTQRLSSLNHRRKIQLLAFTGRRDTYSRSRNCMQYSENVSVNDNITNPKVPEPAILRLPMTAKTPPIAGEYTVEVSASTSQFPTSWSGRSASVSASTNGNGLRNGGDIGPTLAVGEIPDPPAILRTTDVYVRMDDAKDEEFDLTCPANWKN